MSIAIKIENLSKAYQLGEIGTGTISRDIERWVARARGKEDPFLKIGEENDRTVAGKSDIVWSLKEIDFEVEQGDTVGIIGRNGAGKSTLLKILSRVTTPTQGIVKAKGRIASLLEVGTGFHPELTGKENIFLNGAILGMRKKEIAGKLDAIIDFSGVERYIDTPVKRYSSGMYVRLAFAVAAHLDAEILIVDEVLAVGDAEFQKKCLGKMGEISKGQGKTVLFVSHQMDSILRLCKKGIYLKNGKIEMIGETGEVVNKYLSKEMNVASKMAWGSNGPSTNDVRLLTARIINAESENVFTHDIKSRVGVEVEFEIFNDTNNLVCGINLYNNIQVHVLSSHDITNTGYNYTQGIYRNIVWLPGNMLAEGPYSISIAFMSYDPFIVHFHEMDVMSFNITDSLDGLSARGKYGGAFPGVVRPILDWKEVAKI